MKAARLLVVNKYLTFSVFLLTFMSLTIAQFSHAADDIVDKNHVSCVSCHRVPASGISDANLFPEGLDPSSICLDCHHYSDNHHPVNFTPGKVFNNSRGENFPLFDGEVRCLTCHQVHGGRGLTGTPKLLRGGPYQYRTEICFFCHDKDLNTKISPHRMINDRGETIHVNGEPVCLMCHAAVPDQTTYPVRVTFKADVAFLCWRCHPPMGNGDFFKGHFLVKPKKKTLDYMRKKEEENAVSFPLLNRDRITCSTCHNPHQKGVISYGPAQAGADAPTRLRMSSGILCFGCHNM